MDNSIFNNAVLNLAWEDVSNSARSAYAAFQTELHGGNPLEFQKNYTKTAADQNLPNVDVIDPKNPPKIDKPGTYHEVLDVNGIPRTYTVHVPPQYDGQKPLPVVVLLHGHGEDGEQIAQRSGIDKEADQKGFIAVYPDAIQWFGNKQLSAWDAGDGLVPPGTDANDVGFVNSIIDTTGKQLNVDNKRVYVAGYSNGGMLAADVASKLSNKVAAAAIISSGMAPNFTPPETAVPIVSIHGTSDSIIPIEGFPGFPKALNKLGVPYFESYDQATQDWVKADGITSPATVTTKGDITEKDYKDPATGEEVAQYTVAGGTHDWYGSPGDTGPNNSINATDVAWNFFSEHSK